MAATIPPMLKYSIAYNLFKFPLILIKCVSKFIVCIVLYFKEQYLLRFCSPLSEAFHGGLRNKGSCSLVFSFQGTLENILWEQGSKTNVMGIGNMVILKITFRECGRLFLGNMVPPGRPISDTSITGLVTIVLKTYFIDMMISWL